MKRRSLADQACPIARSLDLIGDWWSLLIVRDALAGLRRFRDFERSLPIAKNILTRRLRKLVDDGILEIAPAADGTAYQEYVLTAKGRALDTVIVALWQWNAASGRGRPLFDQETGDAVAPLVVRTVKGKAVASGNAKAKAKGKREAPGARA